VKRANERTIRFFDRKDGKNRRERGMDVNDVVFSLAQNAAQVTAQVPTQRDASLRSIRVNRLAAADADDVRLLFSAGNVRRDHVDMMAAAARLASEKVDVLANAAQVGIVVLGHQRDAQRPLVTGELERW
jgi:hypothetical protein